MRGMTGKRIILASALGAVLIIAVGYWFGSVVYLAQEPSVPGGEEVAAPAELAPRAQPESVPPAGVAEGGGFIMPAPEGIDTAAAPPPLERATTSEE